MFKKVLVITLLSSLLLTSFASAAELDFYKREVFIDKTTVEAEDTLIFTSMPDRLKIPLLFPSQDFNFRSTVANSSCTIEERDYGSLIDCDLPENERGRLTFEFRTNSLTKRREAHYSFEDNLKVPMDTNRLVYTSNLDSGLVLIPENETSPFSSYSPRNGEKGSDGRRIYVYWTREDVTEGEGISPSVSFEEAGEEEPDTSNLYVIGLGSLLIVLLLFLALRTSSGDEDKLPQALKEDERKILEIIKASGNEIKQKRIVSQVDFSKAKVSRLIRDLKERGLIEVKKVGRTNRIKYREE
ncbi:MAG: helix-turn-helix transcriptional regulator [Candidatus Aenigmatarchaeota archaeon]